MISRVQNVHTIAAGLWSGGCLQVPWQPRDHRAGADLTKVCSEAVLVHSRTRGLHALTDGLG